MREFQIESEATFLDLNKAILDSCGYPDDQMTSFYICDDEWERREQITREDMGGGNVDEDLYVMSKTRLSEFIDDEGQKMEFVFDPFSERMFYMDVVEMIPGKRIGEAKLIRSKGDAPQQINDGIDDLLAQAKNVNAGTVPAEEDIFGQDSFDSEDIDPEGFEISDGDPYKE